MKTLIYLVLIAVFSIPVLAQNNYSTKDFGYTNDVKMVEKMEYKYDPETKKHEAFSYLVQNFTNGKLMREDLERNENYYIKSQTRITYKDGFPETYNVESTDFNENYNFKYNNGNLIQQIQIDGNLIRETNYKYNSKNQKTEAVYKSNNIIYATETYSNYSNNDSYQVIEKKFENKKLTSTNTAIFKDGKLISVSTQTDFKPAKETNIYDERGNIVQYQELYNTVIHKNVYVYDAKGNAIQLARCGNPISKFHKENTFVFTKILYNNRNTSGTTDFDKDFVKQFDTNSESYDYVDIATNKKMKVKKISHEYQFLKGEDNVANIQTKDSTNVTEYVSINNIKDSSDIFILEPESGDMAIGKKFNNPETPINLWIDMVAIPKSKSDIYWQIDSNSKIYFIRYGSYLEPKLFKITKSQKNDYDLIVQEKGKAKYILKNPITAKANTINSLETYK